MLFQPLSDFYRCSWYTLVKLNTVTLKVSTFHLALTLPSHLIIGVTKSWPLNISLRLLPYVDKIKEELGPPKDQKSLLIYDVLRDKLQKIFLKDQLQTWYTDEIQKQTDNGKGVYEVNVDTRVSRMKPIHAPWVIGLYDKVWISEKMIENGFKAAAITEGLDPEMDFGEEDPFSHLIQFLCICFYVYVTINVSEL